MSDGVRDMMQSLKKVAEDWIKYYECAENSIRGNKVKCPTSSDLVRVGTYHIFGLVLMDHIKDKPKSQKYFDAFDDYRKAATLWLKDRTEEELMEEPGVYLEVESAMLGGVGDRPLAIFVEHFNRHFARTFPGISCEVSSRSFGSRGNIYINPISMKDRVDDIWREAMQEIDPDGTTDHGLDVAISISNHCSSI